MLDLSLLQPCSTNEKPSEKEISQQLFDKIATFVEKEELETASEMIENALRERILDIRLIVYYLYGHFIEEGVKSFSSTLPVLSSLLENEWESLKPTNRKGRQVENSLNWFFSRLLDKLKYSEKVAKEGKDSPLWEKSLDLSDKEFKALKETVFNFQDFFLKKWSQSPTKERVVHLGKRIEDLHALVVSESQEEKREDAIEEESEEKNVNIQISSPVHEETVLNSGPMQLFMLKLTTFEKLVEKKEYLKAAMVSKDISQMIEEFDPCYYFPKLFTEYFALLAKNISILADEWQNQESLQWKSLEKLYKTDIDRFVQW